MSYAIIGFGKIGHALAEAFARKGIEVSVATTRDPESFAADAAAIGPTIIPKKLAEAVTAADTVFLAVRFQSHRDVAKALPTWKGKTIIDVTMFLLHDGIKPVQILQARHVAHDRRNVSRNGGRGLLQFLLSSSGDHDVRAFFDETLGSGQPDPAASARDDCNLTF